MCAMTEGRIRAVRAIPLGMKLEYYVARGNKTGREFYLTRPDASLMVDELHPFRPLYRIRVHPRVDIPRAHDKPQSQ